MRFHTDPSRPIRMGPNRTSISRLDLKGRVYQRVARAVDRFPWLIATPPYDITVSDDPPFVWYRVTKVGSRTIYRHLRAHVELRLDQPYQVRVPRTVHETHFHFAFVRNPWDRLVSCWQQKVLQLDHFRLGAERERLKSFPAFVEFVSGFDLRTYRDPHIRLQAASFDVDRVDFVGRFERFAEDFADICRRLGVPDSFEHRNPTDHEHYSVYYDDRTAEAVGRLYERDVRLFGYEFERGPLRDADRAKAPTAARSSALTRSEPAQAQQISDRS